MTKSRYGRQNHPEKYFEGSDLKIAQSIYDGRTDLLGVLSKEDINRCNAKGMNFFLYTIYVDNEDAMELLLAKGADVNLFTEVNWHGRTPISFSAGWPKISYVKTLLRHGANPNDNRANPPLFEAVMRNDQRMVDLLLDNGADVNIQYNKNTKSNVLLKAFHICDYDMVNHLLDRGANPMLRDVLGHCLAYEVQEKFNSGKGNEHFKNLISDMKRRLEKMGVVFPVEKIPPKEDEEYHEYKPINSNDL